MANFSKKIINYYNKGYKVIAYGAPTKESCYSKQLKFKKNY